MSRLDPADLQGNILHGYPHLHAAYLFASVDDADAGRAWLGELVEGVTRESDLPRDLTSTLNVALSYPGVAALGLDEAALAGFPEDFRQGMAARAEQLGDAGPSAPSEWEDGLRTRDAHVLLTLYAFEEDERDERLRECVKRVREDGGLRIAVEPQRADGLPDAREHFGFADGFSQPAVEGSGRPAHGAGVQRLFGGWRHLRLGEFVLGHLDEDGVVPGADAPLQRNGTFMVWRKLAQDVPLFRRWLRGLAGEDPDEQERVAAKVVGRWREGGSLVVSPDSPTRAGRGKGFTYSGDRDGLRCPLGAHVRRANPRDALGWRTERSKRHRIIRRGMPYGPLLPEDAPDEDGGRDERGLIFVCLNASIARQFELIQGHWLLDGDAFGQGRDQDLLLAPADPQGKMTVPGHPPRFLAPQEQLVTTRGGEYLFVPGIAALRAMAGG
jgi:Dyp-type peroxidase family